MVTFIRTLCSGFNPLSLYQFIGSTPLRQAWLIPLQRKQEGGRVSTCAHPFSFDNPVFLSESSHPLVG